MYTLSFYGKTKKETNDLIKLSIGKYVTKNIKQITGKDKCEFLIPIPNKLKDKKIKLIEINPLYDGHSFKLNFIYNIPKQTKPESPKSLTVDEMISIDLGIVNLATIYDPSGEQYIIKGTPLISKNSYFNNKLSNLQSIAKKVNGKNYTKQMYNLVIKRKNQIDAYFNAIVNCLYKKYKDKKVIVIGYNEGWKTKVNMGKDNNRIFYQIPYKQFLYKIFRKFKNTQVIEVDESYTSKCDALMFEEMCHHKNYMGKRIKRGLFKSGSGKLLNADVNGAINIMRKYCIKTNITFTKVTGHNIERPIRQRINL